MAKITFKSLRKQYLQNSINLLERKIVVANEYMRVLEATYEEKINKKLNDLKRKHRLKLLPLEKKTISRKQYHQSIINELLVEYDEKQKWQKIAINYKLEKQIAKNAENTEQYQQQANQKIEKLVNDRTLYVQKLETKYPLFDVDEANVLKYKQEYDDLLNQFKIKEEQLEEQLREKYNVRLEKYRLKNEKTLTKLNAKLDKRLNSFNIIFNEERNALLVRKEELESLLKSEESLNLEDLKRELDEINALFEMYEDKSILLRVKNLNMNFGGLKAVDNLSFDIKKGEIFGLIGPNGAGKTTVFNCITQFYKPSSGKVYFDQNDKIINLMDVKVHDVIKQGIVRTFQNVELVWELSVLDNLLVASHTLYESGFFTQLLHLPKLKKEEEVIKAKALRVLEYLGLEAYKDVYPIGLPYGILKRIELARTFMTDPKLIILDEPAAGLNERETADLAETIKQIAKDFGTTIFLVEHDMGLVMDVCDRICAINFGKKLAIGTPKEIQSNPQVQEAYLGGE